MRLDVHAHILPHTLPDWKQQFGYGGFIQLEPQTNGNRIMRRDDGHFFREVEPNCFDQQCVIDELDQHQIDAMVLCTVPVLFSYWTPAADGLAIARFLNDDIAATQAAHPSRFAALGTVPLQDPDLAIRELERCLKELGLAGVQIGSHINDKTLADPGIFRFFEAAQDLGAAVMVHPWDMVGKELMRDYWLPWLVGMPAETSLAICSLIFGGVFERLPKLRVLFAHGGGSFPATFGRIQHGWRVRPDLVAKDNPHDPSKYLGQFWVDSHTCDATMLRFVMDLLGDDKVCFGTDFPFPLGEWADGHWAPGMTLNQLTDEAPERMNKLWGQNALQWLNLPADRFQGANTAKLTSA